MRALLLAAALLPLSACGGGSTGGGAQPAPAVLATCAGCHSLEKNGPRRTGPALAGVVGRRAGSVAGYPYSAALKNSGLTWSKEALDRFLAAPTDVVPGTRMVARVPDPAQRAKVIDALARL